MTFDHQLTAGTLAKLGKIAQMRQAQKRGRGQVNQRIASRSDMSIEFDGLKGEWAASAVLNVPMNLGMEADPGYDLVFNGQTVQVKFTPYKTGVLLFPTLDHFQADCAILTVGLPDNWVRLVGWVPQVEFETLCIYKAKGNGWWGYGVPQWNLYRMESL